MKKIIAFNIDSERYQVTTLEDARKDPDMMPVCTVAHFVHQVCKFFEDVSPNIQQNPMWEKTDWEESEKQTEVQP